MWRTTNYDRDYRCAVTLVSDYDYTAQRLNTTFTFLSTTFRKTFSQNGGFIRRFRFYPTTITTIMG